MSAAQLERNFVAALIRRCNHVFFNRIESQTSVGFPDLVMIWNSQSRLAEAKTTHPGDWIYVRNTQIAWCYKSMMRSFDTPFVIGIPGNGIGFCRFSRLTDLQGQKYKGTHVRYKLQDINPVSFGKYDDWERALISYVFT